MGMPLPHDLHYFMVQIQNEISVEYERIRRERTKQDHGTDGDEGEENWAELLREWLPSNYSVVTKGTIISHDGRESGQIDIIVLKSTYPKALKNKKRYLAAGVAAAFECKNTLRAHHIDKAVRTSADLKALYPIREGTPYQELHAPIIYGLLAHSHSWKGENSTPEKNIAEKLTEADRQHVEHPRLGLDLMCVADLCTLTSFKLTYFNPQIQAPGASEVLNLLYNGGKGSTMYVQLPNSDTSLCGATPVGALISHTIGKMAWEDPNMRDIARYFNLTNIAGSGESKTLRQWSSSIYSEKIHSRVEAGMLTNGEQWSEWSIGFL